MGVSCGGEGNHIRFWHDSWSGRLPLNDLYPDLFECSVDKEALIYDVLVSSSHGSLGVGICSSAELFMIGSWRLSILFLPYLLKLPRVPGGDRMI